MPGAVTDIAITRPEPVSSTTAAGRKVPGVPSDDEVVVIAAAEADLLVAAVADARPHHHGVRKSNGVPATARRSPVGISVASTGVKRAACRVTFSAITSLSALPPPRLK